MATIKQKKALKILGENGGNISAAMREAGYSNVTAHHTEKLTNSKAFKEFWDAIPEDLLIKVQLEGLNAKQFRYSPEGDLVQLDDFATRHKYLDTAMKGKGYYAPEKHANVNVNLDVTDDKALAEAAKTYGLAVVKRKIS